MSTQVKIAIKVVELLIRCRLTAPIELEAGIAPLAEFFLHAEFLALVGAGRGHVLNVVSARQTESLPFVVGRLRERCSGRFYWPTDRATDPVTPRRAVLLNRAAERRASVERATQVLVLQIDFRAPRKTSRRIETALTSAVGLRYWYARH